MYEHSEVKPCWNLVDLWLDDRGNFIERFTVYFLFCLKNDIKWRKTKSYNAKPIYGRGRHLLVLACVVSLKSGYISNLKLYGKMVSSCKPLIWYIGFILKLYILGENVQDIYPKFQEKKISNKHTPTLVKFYFPACWTSELTLKS